MTGRTITVTKRDHDGAYVWHYTGELAAHGDTWLRIEARFGRRDVITDYVTFRQGDRMIEWFFTDRWYNIFEVRDVDDDRLKGWYCNVTRPAEIDDDSVAADDLALDVFVTPAGAVLVLDEDEFTALALSADEHAHALAAVDALRRQVAERAAPFDQIRADGR
jgi:predicted RNA-binding protein associated with RNAse of E/G family